MRTPVQGARLTSKFGVRKHPILGYSKMHRGVDFAAKRGTPIMAAGDGRISFAGRNGSALVEKITIASVGNGATFGDLSVTRNNLSGNSNGHGGLS